MKKVLLLIACVMALTSCSFGEWSLTPSDNIVTKDYQLAPFEEVAMHCVGNVEVEVTFDPPWDMDKMTDAAKMELGLLY